MRSEEHRRASSRSRPPGAPSTRSTPRRGRRSGQVAGADVGAERRVAARGAVLGRRRARRAVPTSLPSMKSRTVLPSHVPAALCHLPSQTLVGASAESGSSRLSRVADVERACRRWGPSRGRRKRPGTGSIPWPRGSRLFPGEPEPRNHAETVICCGSSSVESGIVTNSSPSKCRRGAPEEEALDPRRVVGVDARRRAELAVVAVARPVADDLALALVQRPVGAEREVVGGGRRAREASGRRGRRRLRRVAVRCLAHAAEHLRHRRRAPRPKVQASAALTSAPHEHRAPL